MRCHAYKSVLLFSYITSAQFVSTASSEADTDQNNKAEKDALEKQLVSITPQSVNPPSSCTFQTRCSQAVACYRWGAISHPGQEMFTVAINISQLAFC